MSDQAHELCPNQAEAITVSDGREAVVCNLLTEHCGFRVGIGRELCSYCAPEGKFPKSVPADHRESYLGFLAKRSLLNVLCDGRSDEEVSAIFKGVGRRQAVEKLRAINAPPSEILEAIATGVKNGLPPQEAVKIADEANLYEA